VKQAARFGTQAEAKRFLISRVIEQAQTDGVSLSEAERHMLGWSESDPDFEPNDLLAEAPEVSETDFEPKIAGLIRRAYDRECRATSEAKLLYQEARDKLSEGDHYISVMVAQALG
jgi:hypothetical protein